MKYTDFTISLYSVHWLSRGAHSNCNRHLVKLWVVAYVSKFELQMLKLANVSYTKLIRLRHLFFFVNCMPNAESQ